MTPEEIALAIIPAQQILLPEDAGDYRTRIAAAIREAVAAERERCAGLCERQAFSHRHAGDVGPDMLCIQAARRIREDT